ncbi:MAG: hypothetical protein Kow0031_11910 [Anaerolineae bacterium]
MNTTVKIILGLVGVVILAAIVCVAGMTMITNNFINNSFEVAAENLAISGGDEALARGEHIASAWGCRDCHGENLGGTVLIDDAAMAYLPAPNLTAGQGGVGATYTPIDWVRAIRHGVRPNGESFIIMPSAEYYWMSDADLTALITYLYNLPPVDNDLGTRSFGPVGRMLVYTGQIPLQASQINHTAPRPEPEPGMTVEYGSYLASTCRGCHGPNLNGIGGHADPAGPSATDLTSSGPIGDWSEEDFINTLRSGTTPYGKAMDPMYMPWTAIGQMTDEELGALWMYLQSL